MYGCIGTCAWCLDYAEELYVCAGCGGYGHIRCRSKSQGIHSMEEVNGVLFCSNCARNKLLEFREITDYHEKARWRTRHMHQLCALKDKAEHAENVSRTVGIAITTTAAVATSAVVGVASGIGQAAQMFISSGPTTPR
eukprot:1192182-Pyramimonas_sp.AAC.1